MTRHDTLRHREPPRDTAGHATTRPSTPKSAENEGLSSTRASHPDRKMGTANAKKPAHSAWGAGSPHKTCERGPNPHDTSSPCRRRGRVMAVSKRVRYEVFRRDHFTCRYCGAKDVPLVIDHVQPVSLGGTDDPGNLVTACRDCNAGKTSTSPSDQLVADVSDDAIRWAAAMKQAAEQRRAETNYADEVCAWFEKYWPYDVPRNWRSSITTFLSVGLNPVDMARFVTVATDNRQVADWNDEKFRYFCGCCWTEVRKRQDLARQILDGAAP